MKENEVKLCVEMKRSLVIFVICALASSLGEEIETRKTVKKAGAIEFKNEVESRTDSAEVMTIMVETVHETTPRVSTSSSAPTTTSSAATTSKPESTTKVLSTSKAPVPTKAPPATTTQKVVEIAPTTQASSSTTARPLTSSAPFKPPVSPGDESPDDGDDGVDSHDLDNLLPPSQLPPRRKVVYINQQQNGKLNVHLELSDVSVIVIPNQKDPQLSLLNLLMKSAQKSNMKKKEESVSIEQLDDYSKYKQSLRDDNYRTFGMPFVESRAPYKVDISSTIGQHSKPGVELPPHANQHSSQAASQFQPQFARSPIMQLLRPAPAQGNNRIFKRSIDSRIDADIPGDDYNEDELTESFFNTLQNNENLEGLHEKDESEFVLLGAIENCGPGRQRNSYQICVPVMD